MTDLNFEQLDQDLIRDLEERASLHGCSVEDELNSVLRYALGKEILKEQKELTLQERAKSIEDMFARHGVSVPHLSDEAISPESIYGDRV